MRRATIAPLAVAATVALGALTGCSIPGLAQAAPAPTRTTASTPTSSPSTPAATPSTQPAASPTTTATPTPAPTATPKPRAYLYGPGDTGAKVRELQARLRQIQWYAGKITATYDGQTTKGVKGFQDKRGYQATGTVDKKTWAKLVEMTRQPSSDEMHDRIVAGPALLKRGSTGEKVRELQSRLIQISWMSGDVTDTYGPVTEEAVRGFQAKRGYPINGQVDQRTWDKLVSMTRQPTHNEMYNIIASPQGSKPATGVDQRCMTGRVICVSKTTRKLVWVVNGKALYTMDVRFGSDELPTGEGTFSVFWKSRDHVSTIYHTAMPFALFFNGGQAVHFSPDFAAVGYSGASHGCVNLRDYNGAKWLFDQVNVGDRVVIYW